MLAYTSRCVNALPGVVDLINLGSGIRKQVSMKSNRKKKKKRAFLLLTNF